MTFIRVVGVDQRKKEEDRGDDDYDRTMIDTNYIPISLRADFHTTSLCAKLCTAYL